ncbi:MAG: hypothetical protein ABIO55_14990 [Ginsengibacter sp.]
MDKLQIKRSIVFTLISLIVSFIAFLKITRHSNIKLVEILITVVLGMSISTLIFNIAHLYKIKKNSKISDKPSINTSRIEIFRSAPVLIKPEPTEIAPLQNFK